MVAIMTKFHNKIIFFETKVNLTGITVTFCVTVRLGGCFRARIDLFLCKKFTSFYVATLNVEESRPREI